MASLSEEDRANLDEYVFTSDIATTFEVSIRDVQYYIKKGTIKAQKKGYFYMIHKDDVPASWPPH